MSRVVFLLLAVLVESSLACKCKTQTTKESFCAADWVSHVKLKLRVGKQGLPEGSSRKGLNNIRYVVEHINVYKKPSFMAELPTEIFTPSEAPACGLKIDAGKEYLLAGRLEAKNSLYTVLCGQVLADNSAESSFENVLEWKAVPEALRAQLSSIKC